MDLEVIFKNSNNNIKIKTSHNILWVEIMVRGRGVDSVCINYCFKLIKLKSVAHIPKKLITD